MKSRLATALVAALILGAGLLALSCKGKSNPAGPGGTADVTINIVANAGTNSYSPNPDTISVGQTVAWHNLDGATHTATSNTVGVFDTGNLASGATSSPKALAQGTYPYHCAIHGAIMMSGTLVVRVTP